jgi:uncharacterized protein
MSVALDLTSERIFAELEGRRDALRALGIRKLGLFGSAARSELGPESDLDFLVDLSDKSFRAYFRVLHYLEEAFGRRVDLVMLGALKPSYAPFVLSEVRYLE